MNSRPLLMIVRMGSFVVDFGRRVALRGGAAIALQPKALQLIELLVQSHPRLVTYDEVRETLWPGVKVTAGSLRQLVRLIRKAFKDVLPGDPRITTLHGVGLRLEATLEFAGHCVEERSVSLLVAEGVAGLSSDELARLAPHAEAVVYWPASRSVGIVIVDALAADERRRVDAGLRALAVLFPGAKVTRVEERAGYRTERPIWTAALDRR